jgi:hypothetical protein
MQLSFIGFSIHVISTCGQVLSSVMTTLNWINAFSFKLFRVHDVWLLASVKEMNIGLSQELWRILSFEFIHFGTLGDSETTFAQYNDNQIRVNITMNSLLWSWQLLNHQGDVHGICRIDLQTVDSVMFIINSHIPDTWAAIHCITRLIMKAFFSITTPFLCQECMHAKHYMPLTTLYFRHVQSKSFSCILVDKKNLKWLLVDVESFLLISVC